MNLTAPSFFDDLVLLMETLKEEGTPVKGEVSSCSFQAKPLSESAVTQHFASTLLLLNFDIISTLRKHS